MLLENDFLSAALMLGLALSQALIAEPGHAQSAGCPSDCRTLPDDADRFRFGISFQDTGAPSSPTLIVLRDMNSSSSDAGGITPHLTRGFRILELHLKEARLDDALKTRAATAVADVLKERQVSSFILAMPSRLGPLGLKILKAHPGRAAGLLVSGTSLAEYSIGLPWEGPIRNFSSGQASFPVMAQQMSLNVQGPHWQLTVALREGPSERHAGLWHVQLLMETPEDEAQELARLLNQSGPDNETDDWADLFEKSHIPVLFNWTRPEAVAAADQEQETESLLVRAVFSHDGDNTKAGQMAHVLAHRKVATFLDQAATR